MITWSNRLVLATVLAAIGAAVLGASIGSATQAESDLERALLLEDTGKLEAALELYGKILQSSPPDEVAANVHLRRGLCYERLGREQALDAYRTVVDKFPAQSEAVRLAREGLIRLGIDPGQRNGLTVREVFRSNSNAANGVADPAIDPTLFSVSPDGRRFIYTDWETGDLALYDVSTGLMKRLYGSSYAVGEHLTSAISRDGRRIAFGWESWEDLGHPTNSIRIDSAEGGAMQTVIEIPEAEGWIAQVYDWHPDGSKLLAGYAPSRNWLDGSETTVQSTYIVEVDLKSGSYRRLADVGPYPMPRKAQYSPKGDWIVYDSAKSGESKIYRVASGGGREEVLIDSPGADDSPLWSSDGRFLVYRSNRSGAWDILAQPMRNGVIEGLPLAVQPNVGDAYLRGMTGSGRLYYSQLAAGWELLLADRKGGSRKIEHIGTRFQRDVRFARDGKHLLYNAITDIAKRTGNLVIADRDGRPLKQQDFGRPLILSAPSSSPDGSKIAVITWERSTGKRELCFVSAATGELLGRCVALPNARMFRVSGWSSDGRVFYGTGFSGTGNGQLVGFDVETGNLVSRTDLPDGTWGGGALISPDGTRYLVLKKGDDPATSHIVIRSFEDDEEKNYDAGEVLFPPRWDWDSMHILVRTVGEEGAWYRLSLETGEKELYFRKEGGRNLALMDVSPDGEQAVFRNGNQDWRIWALENFLPMD